MTNFERPNVFDGQGVVTFNQYLTKVFMHMGLGLVVTAAVAFGSFYSIYTGGIVYQLFFSNSMMMFVLLFAQLGIVIALGRGLNSFSTTTCRLLFLGYSALTGLTFGVLPIAYGVGTVFTAFIYAAVLFVSMAIIGKTTSVDLSKYSGLLIGGLFTVVIMSVLSIFIPVLRNNILISYLGLIIFLGITAWDVQRIKGYYLQSSGALQENLAVYGAFQLYLDFINIFIYLLRILSRNSKN